MRAAEVGLAALPRVAASLGIDGEIVDRMRASYEQHTAEIRADGALGFGHKSDADRDKARRLRLGVLEYKRQAVTELRDAREIDDIVLRELQKSMDTEEVRLLGRAPAE